MAKEIFFMNYSSVKKGQTYLCFWSNTTGYFGFFWARYKDGS